MTNDQIAASDTARVERLREEAQGAVDATLRASIEAATSDEGFARALRLMFGVEKGKELFKDNARARDAAAGQCGHCVRFLPARPGRYDVNKHLAAQAIYYAAQERMKRSEAAIKARNGE